MKKIKNMDIEEKKWIVKSWVIQLDESALDALIEEYNLIED